jgi:NTP pyrophosphatase (non-canonical NTP hydrolase)
MNKTLLAYIKELSDNDKKTFSQKVLKLFEEGGELAKKALPYDDAHGTRHRYTSREAILEEVADVILVALSIGYDLDMDDDDLDDIIMHKAKYWNKLQDNESATVSTSLPYEIHVTVQLRYPFDGLELVCEKLENVKPLLLRNYSIEKDTTEVVMMTSSVVKGTASEADCKMKNIVSHLKDYGYTIIRQKIETVPWHPAANNIPKPPVNESNVFAAPNKFEIFYFENHLKVRLPEDAFDSLKNAVKAFSASSYKTDSCGISWNDRKPVVDGVRTYFVTFRSKYKSKEEFTERAKMFAEYIRGTTGVIEVSSENIEFAIYDTAEVQDKTWISTLE